MRNYLYFLCVTLSFIQIHILLNNSSTVLKAKLSLGNEVGYSKNNLINFNVSNKLDWNIGNITPFANYQLENCTQIHIFIKDQAIIFTSRNIISHMREL